MATLTQKTALICKVSSFYWPVRSLNWHLLGSDGHVNFIIERQNTVTACIMNLKGEFKLIFFNRLMIGATEAYVPIWKRKVFCVWPFTGADLEMQLLSCSSCLYLLRNVLHNVVDNNASNPDMFGTLSSFAFTRCSSSLTGLLIPIIKSGDCHFRLS